jgi:Uma2 family endonuclease
MIVKSDAGALAPSVESMEHVVLYDVPWKAYEAILEAMGDRRFRHSYDRGVLEIMSPLKRHDRAKKLIARFIETLTFELRIPIQSIGSTTLRKKPKEKGLEPDECYYIAHEPEVRDKPDYDPDRDPPPDLAIEVDVTSSSVGRMPIFAGLGIPEVWRFNGSDVTFVRLNRNGKYVPIPRSRALPFITPSVVESFLAKRFEVSEHDLMHEFVKWVRKAARSS